MRREIFFFFPRFNSPINSDQKRENLYMNYFLYYYYYKDQVLSVERKLIYRLLPFVPPVASSSLLFRDFLSFMHRNQHDHYTYRGCRSIYIMLNREY